MQAQGCVLKDPSVGEQTSSGAACSAAAQQAGMQEGELHVWPKRQRVDLRREGGAGTVQQRADAGGAGQRARISTQRPLPLEVLPRRCPGALQVIRAKRGKVQACRQQYL
jgi:hypothetical protein